MLADIDVDGHGFSAMFIESVSVTHWLQEGKKVLLVFKETEVSLAKDIQGRISIRNRLPCTVVSIDKGTLLSKIDLQFKGYLISSVITTRSAGYLEIQPGDEVIAMIKSNEIAVMEMVVQ